MENYGGLCRSRMALWSSVQKSRDIVQYQKQLYLSMGSMNLWLSVQICPDDPGFADVSIKRMGIGNPRGLRVRVIAGTGTGSDSTTRAL